MKKNNLVKQIKFSQNYHIAVVVSDYYKEISNRLLKGTEITLKQYSNISFEVFYVSGSFELPIACKQILQHSKFDAAVALGVVIQGQTKHFDFVCSAVSDGLMRVMLECNKVIGFGVLTVNNLNQANERSVISEDNQIQSYSNKGVETSLSVIQALKLKESIS